MTEFAQWVFRIIRHICELVFNSFNRGRYFDGQLTRWVKFLENHFQNDFILRFKIRNDGFACSNDFRGNRRTGNRQPSRKTHHWYLSRFWPKQKSIRISRCLHVSSKFISQISFLNGIFNTSLKLYEATTFDFPFLCYDGPSTKPCWQW